MDIIETDPIVCEVNMLPKIPYEPESGVTVRLRRLVDGQDKTAFGAFPHGTVVTLRAEVPRTLGAAAVVLRLAPDGGAYTDTPFAFVSTDFLTDIYETRLDTAALCDASGGLFWYELLFVRGADTRFSDSVDNLHFTLSPQNAARFRLLVYASDFHTPAWLAAGTMYHIFVDRFKRDRNAPPLKPGARLNPDWAHGIPEFAAKNGDPLENRTFFGGTLDGITEELDRLRSLGVTILYLSPIFDARSNHRYDTGDYETVDSALGGDAAFDRLLAAAHERGMRVILDGVFNHTGDDSRYFNRPGSYPEVGAYQSEQSPYAHWYRFRHFPDDYECWWGIPILPRLMQDNPDCRRYFTEPGGILSRWLARGADGWRLDVADELPDAFLDELRTVAKGTTDGQAAIIGEVWENAADKIAYGKRRRYLLGGQLDSVMNYPFRNAVLDLLRRHDAAAFVRTLTEIYASYPREVSDSLMNLLGTHDTARILTVLGDPTEGDGRSNAELSTVRLSPDARRRALKLLRIASTLQFTVYGFPSVYYGDEAGLEGYHDPFCRRPYPWGAEDPELLAHYRLLGRVRAAHPALHGGDFRFLFTTDTAFLYERVCKADRILVAVNVAPAPALIPLPGTTYLDLLTSTPARSELLLPPLSCALLVETRASTGRLS